MNVTIILATELAEFLETRGVLEQYKRNIENDTMFKLLVAIGVREFTVTEICNGFVWERSPEGHTFWAELHHEYSKVFMFQLQKN
jgi:hypothetical protein